MDGPIAIDQVYGPVGTGYSRAHYVGGRDGVEYVAKGTSFARKFRHVAANEIVSAELALLMGLPIPKHRLLTLGKKLFFGSSRVIPSKFHPTIDLELFGRCANADQVYELAVFDTWICNVDRHSGNFLVLCSGSVSPGRRTRCDAPEHRMVLIDHDGSFLPDNRETSFFASRLSTRISECVKLEFIHRSIIERDRLIRAISSVEAISEDDINNAIASVPGQLLPPKDRNQWASFLLDRKGLLRQLFNAERSLFPWLQKGEI